MTILSGAEFKKLAEKNNWSLVKYLHSDDFTEPQTSHHGYQYKFGLNVIPEDQVMLNYNKQCSAGGLYFTYLESCNWVNYHWFEVTVPDDAQVLIEDNKKFKTDKLILVKKMEKTEKICLALVKKKGLNLQYIEEQTPKICLAAVKASGCALEYVHKQTHEICMAAVKNDGFALKYVKEQTYEMCVTAAAARNGLALIFVHEQTHEICMAAVKNNGFALKYVKEQTPEICMAAVTKNGYALRYVRAQTPEICLAAEASKKR